MQHPRHCASSPARDADEEMTAGHRVSRASRAGLVCATGLPRRFVRTRPTNVGSRAAGGSSRVRDRTVLACGCGLNEKKPHDRILSHSPRSRGTSRTSPPGPPVMGDADHRLRAATTTHGGRVPAPPPHSRPDEAAPAGGDRRDWILLTGWTGWTG